MRVFRCSLVEWTIFHSEECITDHLKIANGTWSWALLSDGDLAVTLFTADSRR